jgi:hypothetical protein
MSNLPALTSYLFVSTLLDFVVVADRQALLFFSLFFFKKIKLKKIAIIVAMR